MGGRPLARTAAAFDARTARATRRRRGDGSLELTDGTREEIDRESLVAAPEAALASAGAGDGAHRGGARRGPPIAFPAWSPGSSRPASALALAVAVGLWLVAAPRAEPCGRHRRARRRGARARIHAAVEEETAAHTEEIRRTLARERADTISQLAAEERRLGEERRATFAERERRAGEALADTLADVERRLDERLQGVVDDLERAQRHLEAQLARLQQRQQQAMAEVEARIEREAAELGSTSDEQRRAVVRLREELERAAATAVTEALDELEAHTIERRRSIEEITERLRAREEAIAEGIEQAETDARARLELTLVDFERRQTERLERVTEREIDRHAQLAATAFDARMREIREEAATKLARELDRAVELITREELVRRLDGRRVDERGKPPVRLPTKSGRVRRSDHESRGHTDRRGTMAEITETTIERENEQAKVESWRLHVLIEAGFPLPLAERLAASDADLHTSVDLLRQGCTPATAAEILL